MNNIISLSGGKDSTAMLLMLIERKEPIHSIVFFDTSWEFPEMYDHINKLEMYINHKIIRLKPQITFNALVVKNSWPHMCFRMCTSSKRDALKKYQGNFKPYNACIGYAFDEQKRKKKKLRLHKNCGARYPLIEMHITEKQALAYCYEQGFKWSGLYEKFDRASCYCCPFKKIGDYWKIRKYYPKLWDKMLKIDKLIKFNRGFRGYKTVHDLEKRFQEEDRQLKLF